jgi:hypothetical protein
MRGKPARFLVSCLLISCSSSFFFFGFFILLYVLHPAPKLTGACGRIYVRVRLGYMDRWPGHTANGYLGSYFSWGEARGSGSGSGSGSLSIRGTQRESLCWLTAHTPSEDFFLVVFELTWLGLDLDLDLSEQL